jgi:hypothetical protein
MERQSATRKTPLMRAPRVSARCHYALLATYSRIYCRSTHSVGVCFRVGLLAGDLDCPQSDKERYDIVQLRPVSIRREDVCDKRTMWNESATRARECTVYPAISSTKKNAVSMPSSIMIRVDLESPMFAVSQRKRRCRCVWGGRCYWSNARLPVLFSDGEIPKGGVGRRGFEVRRGRKAKCYGSRLGKAEWRPIASGPERGLVSE